MMGQLFGTKNFEAIKPDQIKTKFRDVAGMHEAKMEITQFVDFLKNPDRYIEMGAKVPKGAILTGPPGTGKTLLARACAGEANVPFYYVSGSDFVQKYVGLGAARVRKLFDAAEKIAPSIVFIDEIDAIGKKRAEGPFSNEEKDNTLNQLLVRMDGFQTKSKVIVMAATNRKQALDPALMRPGRFDRSVEISLPNFEERKEILKVHLQKIKFNPELTIDEVANKVSIMTPGFSGAQLANVCNQSAILAARLSKQWIQTIDFQKATQRVIAGLQKRNLFSLDQKKTLAYYQCGKTVIGWFMQGSDPVIKVSILPFSKQSKGYNHSIQDETSLKTYEQLLGKVCYYLAGRCAELHFRQAMTTNGQNDLKRAKNIVYYIVTKFGMSQKLHNIAFPEIQFIRKPYSEQIQTIIDQQIQQITKTCQQKVEQMISEKAHFIQQLKQKIMEKQTLTHAQIQQILGKRPYVQNENYQKFLQQQQKNKDQIITNNNNNDNFCSN